MHNRNNWNDLTVCKQINSFKNKFTNKLYIKISSYIGKVDMPLDQIT